MLSPGQCVNVCQCDRQEASDNREATSQFQQGPQRPRDSPLSLMAQVLPGESPVISAIVVFAHRGTQTSIPFSMRHRVRGGRFRQGLLSILNQQVLCRTKYLGVV